MRLAAVDLGASFVKSALLDTETLTVSRVERVPFPPFAGGLPPGRREVPVATILEIVKKQLDRLLADEPDCGGIVSCGQMHGLVLTDKQRNPLTPFISWMDERSFSLQGTASGSTAAILFSLAQSKQLPEGATPHSLSDFILVHLCGSEAACEPTMASGFGLFDAQRSGWRADEIERLGLNPLAWPRIASYREPTGHYRSASGKKVPVYASLGDQQCALLGSLLKPGELSVNVSTGAQVSLLSERFVPGDREARSYFDGLFLNTVTHLPSGRTLNPRVDRLGGWEAAEQTGELREAYEELAGSYHAAAQKLGKPASWKRLVFSGGLIVKSRLLQQTVRKRFGLEARVSPTGEDTLFGLLLISCVLSGRSRDLAQAIKEAENKCTGYTVPGTPCFSTTGQG